MPTARNLFKLNFIATYNTRSQKEDSEKNMVCAKKVMTLPYLTALYGTRSKYIQHIAKKLALLLSLNKG
jgi:hypothetical protein